jgi:hypothetical protein
MRRDNILQLAERLPRGGGVVSRGPPLQTLQEQPKPQMTVAELLLIYPRAPTPELRRPGVIVFQASEPEAARRIRGQRIAD